jgi:hypothetical protein
MPTNQALQVFYGTIPLILIVAVAAWPRESKLILVRGGRLILLLLRVGVVLGGLWLFVRRLAHVDWRTLDWRLWAVRAGLAIFMMWAMGWAVRWAKAKDKKDEDNKP